MLGAQGLSRARPDQVTTRHLHRVMQRMGVLQIDSVNVFARSHYMPLFSRLGIYDTKLAERTFLTRSRQYTEYLAHEATFLPTADWSLWQFRMQQWRRRLTQPGSWMQEHARTVDWVRAELRDRDTLRPADLRDDAPRKRGSWWDWDDSKLALEYLWRCGEVAIVGREGFTRRYARAERVIPATVLDHEIGHADAVRELVCRAFRSYGVATASDVDDYYRLRDRAAVNNAIADLVDAGEIEPVSVHGWTRDGRQIPAWRHREATLPRRADRAALLTPFDPVVWFRQRTLRMFELDYRIEIYVPAHKRRYGYYSLPVLVGDRIAATVDLKSDRATSTLRVQSAWWMPQARTSDASALATELVRAATWQGLSAISVSRWGDAVEEIARELHQLTSALERHHHPREDS